MATLEVIYHLHCLNLLRKSTFVDHEYYSDDPVFQDPKFDIKFRLRKRNPPLFPYVFVPPLATISQSHRAKSFHHQLQVHGILSLLLIPFRKLYRRPPPTSYVHCRYKSDGLLLD